MFEMDYKAAGILGTIATVAYCITQASHTGIILSVIIGLIVLRFVVSEN